MTKFKQNDFKVHSESSPAQDPSELKIIKLDSGMEPIIKEFHLSPIKEKGAGEYQANKAKYGPLAATDTDRSSRAQKDRRFALNPLLRDPLSVEQEERRVIEEKVRARVNAISDEAKAAAAQQGYKDGLKKGFEEAYKKIKDEGSASLAKFDQLVNEAETAKVEIFRANERFLIELVFRIARMVLLRELSTDKEYILRLARELVNRVGVSDNVTLRIHPEDADTLDKLKDGLKKAYGEMRNLNIEASSQVKRGGCQIETEWNVIDASIETQLQEIYNAMIGKVSAGDSSAQS